MYDWREDIKKVMNRAGVAAKPTVFMIDDSQLVSESFLEDINGILNTGEVANLLNAEEMGVLQVHFLLICICNFHVLNHFLLIYMCKLHWNPSGGSDEAVSRSGCEYRIASRGVQLLHWQGPE
jgi:P-loop containing dynein motor region D4